MNLAGRTPRMMALALSALVLAVLAAPMALRPLTAEPPASGCSSCDARHKALALRIAGRTTGTTP
jgi:hypothetical protein